MKLNRVLLPAVVLVCAALLTCLGAKQSYEDLCDAIISHAQQASSQHNAGNAAAAELEVSRAIEAFQKARKLDPRSPQAFANIANFYHNIQRFTDAIQMWQETSKRTADKSMKEYLASRARFSEFGMHSVNRDRSYSKGQGNISEAVGHAKKQLNVYHMPEVLYDIATMEVMLSELNSSLEDTARLHFAEAQQISFEAFVAGRKMLGEPCEGTLISAQDLPEVVGTILPGDSVRVLANPSEIYGQQFASQDFRFQDGSVYLAHLHDVALSGNDGIIVQRGRGRCHLFLSTAGVQEKLHLNLQLAATWNPGPGGALTWHDAHAGRLAQHGATTRKVRHIARAVTLLQFTVQAYYHFLVECLGRLVLVRELLESDADVLVLLPQSKGAPFIRDLLALLPFAITPERLLPYSTDSNPDTRVTVGELIWPSWQPVRKMAHSAVPLPSLVPQAVLQRLHAAFVPQAPPAPRRVIFITRKESMRRLANEAQVLQVVATALVAAPALELVVFEGANHSTAATLALFSQAHAVIGVHGGALANIVFCAPRTHVVELGFAASFSDHYAQMAAGLALQYRRLALQPSERGLGAATVTLGPDALKQLAAIMGDIVSPLHTEL